MWLLVKPVGPALFVMGRHKTRTAALRAARLIEGRKECFGVVPDTIGGGPFFMPPYLHCDERYKGHSEKDLRWQLSELSLCMGEM